MQNLKLEKKGRYTYIVVGGKSIRCSSAKAGRELLDCLKSRPTKSAYKPGEAPTFMTMPWFNWSRGYGQPPAEFGHECDHHLDESGPNILVKDDKGNWVEMVSMACDKPLREKPPVSSLDLAKGLVGAIEREIEERAKFRATRRVWAAGGGSGGYEPHFGNIDEANRPKPDYGKIWDLVDGKNVEVDFRDWLEENIKKGEQTVSAGKCRDIIEGTPAGQFHLQFTQMNYRVCDHSQLDHALTVSDFWNRTVPNSFAQACWLRGYLSEVWNLDSAVIATRDDGAHLGVITNERWASDKYPERLVFWRVEMGHSYPRHIFDPNWPGYPTMPGRGPKKHHCPVSWKNEEGLILF